METNLEKKQRLQQMIKPDSKWDLRDNDIDAIKYGLACIEAYADLIIQSVADRASEVGVQPEVSLPKPEKRPKNFISEKSFKNFIGDMLPIDNKGSHEKADARLFKNFTDTLKYLYKIEARSN